MNNKSIYKTAILSKIIIVILSLITSSLINRTLGVTLKGEYAYISNLVTIGMVLFSFGLGQAYSTFKREKMEKCLQIFVSLSFVHFVICVLTGVLAFLFVNNYYAYWSIFLSSLSLLRNNLLYFSAIEDVRKRDYNNIIYKLIYTIIIILVFVLKIRSLNLMLILFGVEDLIIIIGTCLNYKIKPEMKSLLTCKRKMLKKIYKTGIISMLMVLMMSFNYNADIIVLKVLSTTTSVGLYSIGVQLANMLWLIPDAFKDILFFKTAKEDSIKDVVLLTKVNIYINIIIILGFIIFGKIFIYIMYGKEFINSYFITVLLFIGGISMTIYKLIHPLYIAKGKQNLILYILMISVFLNIIMNFILIPKIDIIGAAIASIFSYSICGGIFLFIFCKEYNIKMLDFFIFNKNEIIQIGKIVGRKKND